MGAPELPNDPGEEVLRTTDILYHAPSPSDDSDNDFQTDATYDGYQPLAMEDNQTDYGYIRANEENDHSNDYSSREDMSSTLGEDERVHAISGDPNIPHVELTDVEIEREVWSQPRPEELQIELDSNKTQQILNAMANFQLPNLAVPNWAAGVPEELWKEELLQRIRQRKIATDTTKVEVDKHYL